MHLFPLLLSSSIWTVSAAPPSASLATSAKPEHGGFSLRMTKRNTTNPLHKRANGVASNNKWWITLGIGTPPQDLNFLPDSGAPSFSMQSTLEPKDKQGNEILYDPSMSSTAQRVSGYTYSECFVSGYCDSGVVYRETVTVGGQAFASIPIMVQTDSSNAVYNDRTGNLGLNPDSGGQSTEPTRLPTFMQTIKSKLAKGVVALSYNTYTLTGALDVGFIDSNKYTGALTYVNNQQGETSWVVHFDGMVIDSKLVSIPMQATVDSGSGGAQIPRKALDTYFSKISGATFNSGARTYDFPCDASLPDMTFSVGLLALRVPKYSWIGTPVDGTTNTCRCQMYTSDTEDTAFLGEAFLEGVFVIFDYDNLRVGFANRPAYSTTIPTLPVAGSTNFCTGTGFTGDCVQAQWQSNTCGPLTATKYYHNVGSFSPSVGACTLYSDEACASPLPYAANVRSPGISNTYGSGPLVGSYACFYPSDYPPTPGAGFLQFCTGINFSGDCRQIDWKSWACQNLPDGIRNNVKSSGPNQGYCFLYTKPNCNGAIQDGAPFVFPGTNSLAFGNKVQSFMCI